LKAKLALKKNVLWGRIIQSLGLFYSLSRFNDKAEIRNLHNRVSGKIVPSITYLCVTGKLSALPPNISQFLEQDVNPVCVKIGQKIAFIGHLHMMALRLF
jgi:hypothetical protein